MRKNSTRLRVKIYLIFIVVCCFIQPVSAQETKFKRITVKEGLSQSTVNCMLRDRHGFMWIGTQDGLNFYDGYSFKVFRNNPQDSTSLNHNYIWAIAESDDGRLWVATLRGLARFNYETNSFERYRYDLNTVSENTSVRGVLEDNAGQVWIGVDGGGLSRLDQKTKTFAHHKIESPGVPALYQHNSVRTIYKDKSGDIWIGTMAGLARFNIPTNTFEQFQHDPRNRASLAHNRVYAIYEDRDERLWVGTYGGGLDLFNRTTKTFTHFKNDPRNPASLSDDRVTVMYQDQGQRLWVGTQDGLNLFDPETKTFKIFNHDPKNDGTLSDGWITSIAEDPAGQLLIGTYGGGLNMLNLKAKKFEIITQDPANPASLSNKNIWSIAEDHRGQLWVGSDNGLNRYDAQTKTFKHFRHDPANPKSISGNVIVALYKDKQDRFWVGTHGQGLNRFNPVTQTFDRFVHDPDDPTSLLDNSIVTIRQDRKDQLWVLTNKGLNRFNEKTKKFEQFRNDPKNLNYGMAYNSASAFLADTQGRIWVGTDGGLSRFNEETQSFEYYKHDPKNPQSLSSNFVYFIFEDKRGWLWVGTGAGGLNLFDPDTKTFKRILERDGLPDDILYGMLEDNQGRLWLSSNRGISRYTPSQDPKPGNWGEFRNYDVTDGLQNNEYSAGAYFKGQDGRMYFGGVNGYNVFHPDSIQDDPFVPPIVLTGLEIFNKPVSPGQQVGNFKLRESITKVQELVLTHTESVFTLEFAALSYVLPERNKYAYKLEGFDADWNYTDASRRFATYTNLDPGTYTFRVKGSNHDGVWNEAGHALTIIVEPPWWETWVFKLILILGAVGAILFAFIVRTNSIREANQNLTEAVEQKTKELKRQNDTLSKQRKEMAFQNEKLLQSQEEISTQRDLVEQQNRELSKQREELAEQNIELNNLNTEKDNLISIVAHDLKAPLKQIIGLTNIIKLSPTPLDPETATYVQMIETSVNRLTDMIGKILDVESLDSKQLKLKLEPINLSGIVQAIVDRYAFEARKKQIRIHTEISERVMATLDRNFTDQIIENIVSNAVKFSPAHKNIFVTVIERDTYAICTIRDEGPGLTEDDKKKLFGKYQRLSAFPTGNETSTGLGLSIVKKFVDAMQGEIRCQSEPGKGASFIVKFKQFS
jgi:ligand-binding sensor domain-containing protein/signal transduction histidine kinase